MSNFGRGRGRGRGAWFSVFRPRRRLRLPCSLALALAPAMLLACAGPELQPTTQPAPQNAADALFERAVTGIEVRGPDGQPYAHPFLGGFDVPRPHFIDIDGDGDLDLFVQERSNELIFLENTGSAARPVYTWRTDRYQDLVVGEWTRFVDLDRDGDLDLLAEEPFSYIRYYRNEGSKSSPKFTLAADSLRDDQGKPIFSDRQNIPNISNIDCDGLYDLFLGRVEGTITRYEEVANSGPVPRFHFVNDRFQDIEIIGQVPGTGSLHGANTMYFADVDADRDLDFFWGDFFEDGVLFIPNTGTCETPDLRTPPVPIMVDGAKLSTSGYNVPVLVDYDGDRDLDLFVGVLGGAHNPNRTASDNFYYLERTASDRFELRTRRFLSQVDLGSESVPAFGDIDGDGDPDLIIGNKLDASGLTTARLFLFRNTGSARNPSFELSDTLSLDASYHYAPTLADLDADGDLDLVLGTWNDGVRIYINGGTRQAPDWQLRPDLTITLTRGSNSTPALADIDADGDLDLFIGEASGELNFYRNTGSAREPRFTLESDRFGELDAGRRSHPAFADVDGDGDLDMLAGREAAGALWYRNEGTRQQPRFVADSTALLSLPHNGSPVFIDIDGDGDLDLFSGSLGGGLLFFRRTR